ncbi:MAG: efflux RND transporter periplasmic adaptor subunit [Chitinophagaceae bacterium]|jgi:HlyD family secretion protein|nr:efflux RND transporter periplasmic adaptor subunit [Chitinophagaceae bacterium]
MKKRTIWILAVVIIVIVGLIVAKKKGIIGKDEGLQVAIEKVTQRTIVETVNASGRIYPEVEVKVSSDVSGEITELSLVEGDSVKRGQVIARIYADILGTQQQQAAAIVSQQEYQVANVEAQIAGLESAVEVAQANYDRQRKLLAEKVISQSEFEQADNQLRGAKANLNAALRNKSATLAAVKSAQASLQRASKDVSRTTITAPMDGIVTLLNVKKGERVVGTAQMAGTEMMRIADMSRIEIRVDVTENDVPKVSLGDSALITVDAYINRKFKGVVYQIASSQNGAVNAATTGAATSNEVTNYKVFIRLLPESYMDLIDPKRPRSFPFRPGMTASADIQTRRKENVLTVPLNAVTTRDKKEKNDGDKDKKGAESKAAEPAADMAGSGEEADDAKEVVVFVYDAKTMKVKKVNVTTGIQDTRFIEITGGLQAGAEVVSEPYNTIYRLLKDGMQVKVVEKEKLFEIKK